MQLKTEVISEAADAEYGGTQVMECVKGEFILDEIFKLNFFRIVIDDIVGDALCFRLMEGAVAHYFVLEGVGDTPFSKGRRLSATTFSGLRFCKLLIKNVGRARQSIV